MYNTIDFAGVAQMVERFHGKEEVASSILAASLNRLTLLAYISLGLSPSVLKKYIGIGDDKRVVLLFL